MEIVKKEKQSGFALPQKKGRREFYLKGRRYER
jgi:hypothetical protein